MRYIDGDYAVKNNGTSSIPKDSNIVDVYFVRKPHHCKKTNEYWDSKCDESIYLTVRDDNSSIERTVCLAKNEVSETEVYFDDESEKAKFFDEFRDKEFYNHLSIYCPLSDKQAVQFLSIMSRNIDEYDYNFQYCDQDRVLKNIVSSNLNKNDAVKLAYNLYLECSKQSKQKYDMDSMLKEATTDNVVSFPSKVNK